VADYRFETTWRLPASRSEAWALLLDGEGWSGWWPSVRGVELLAAGAPGGVGRRLRYHFATRLPYTLTFDARLVEVVEPTRLVAAAEGELAGTWTCELARDGEDVLVRHVWSVRTTRPWMNVLAPLAAPLFAWNHAALMREGGHGFAARLGTVAVVEDAPRQRRRRGATAIGGAVVAAAWLLVRARRRR
jgi:uncharacterized protein YndB with AHSA1/START domain